jgi:hypothetical protein
MDMTDDEGRPEFRGLYETGDGRLAVSFNAPEPELSELAEGWRQLLSAVRAIEGRGGRVVVSACDPNLMFTVREAE